MPGIVVGVDGSDHSRTALEWAVKEAGIRQAPLTVLAVHPVAISPWTGAPITFPTDQPEEAKLNAAVQEMTDGMISQVGDPKPASVTVHTVSGGPSEELITASADTDMLVVGSRGSGGFARLVMGSVSMQVVQHAHCPVVVIPTGQPR